MGSIWEDEQYKWSREYDLCVEYIEDFYKRLETDYIDILILHLVDDMDDFAAVMDENSGNSFYQYALNLKSEGRVKFIGISTHSVSVALAAVNSKKLDLIEFPVNPIFDTFEGDLAIEYLFSDEAYADLKDAKIENQRIKLYRYCEQMGIPITAIKMSKSRYNSKNTDKNATLLIIKEIPIRSILHCFCKMPCNTSE